MQKLSLHSVQFPTLDRASLLKGIFSHAEKSERDYSNSHKRHIIRLAKRVCMRLCQLVVQNRHRTPAEVASYLREVVCTYGDLTAHHDARAIMLQAKSDLATHLNAWYAVLARCGVEDGAENYLEELLSAAALQEIAKHLKQRGPARLYAFGMNARPSSTLA